MALSFQIAKSLSLATKLLYLPSSRRLNTSSMASSIKIACGQMCSSSDLGQNARVAKKLIQEAIAADVKVLFLPEAADYLARDPTHSVALAETTHSVFLLAIQDELAKVYKNASGPEADKGLYVAVGVHEPGEGENRGKKVRNNQLWIDNKGEIVHRYQKLHLFDINIANGPILKESNSVEPGKEILPPFPVNDGTYSKFHVGFAICYDIRFGELALRLRKLGANILTYPSAFTTKTGELHWLELGKARAIDSQSYVVMAAQCGEHNVYADAKEGEAVTEPLARKKRESYGKSVIISPWGNVVGIGKDYKDELTKDSDGDYYELVVGELELGQVDEYRQQLPVFTHRRPEIFGYEV